MKALEDWNVKWSGLKYGPLSYAIADADAAIAELQGDLTECGMVLNGLRAELASLKAQRCDNCAEGDVATLDGRRAGEPAVYCGLTCLWWESRESCSRWQPREEATDE